VAKKATVRSEVTGDISNRSTTLSSTLSEWLWKSEASVLSRWTWSRWRLFATVSETRQPANTPNDLLANSSRVRSLTILTGTQTTWDSYHLGSPSHGWSMLVVPEPLVGFESSIGYSLPWHIESTRCESHGRGSPMPVWPLVRILARCSFPPLGLISYFF